MVRLIAEAMKAALAGLLGLSLGSGLLRDHDGVPL
jgi:hypothetical protein